MADGPKHVQLTDDLHTYLVEHSTPPDEVLLGLIDATAEHAGDFAMMQIAPEQGAFLTWFVRAMGVQHAIEIGTFTGYSALCIARGLPDDGQLICLDVSDEWTSVGRPFWEQAGVADKIDLRLGPALASVAAMPELPTFDFAFIDADKPNYAAYLEALLPRLTDRGVVAVDNVLWSGAVVDPDVDDENTRAIRAFNDAVAVDDRLDIAMLPLSDGVTLISRR
ncbi:MAG TPA: class I SAM-dependent methyltransferase [Acidimicrobiales bacterium]|nr:class I SAM-dependent methyltransferase [Acidimicrobiales bacterium]